VTVIVLVSLPQILWDHVEVANGIGEARIGVEVPVRGAIAHHGSFDVDVLEGGVEGGLQVVLVDLVS